MSKKDHLQKSDRVALPIRVIRKFIWLIRLGSQKALRIPRKIYDYPPIQRKRQKIQLKRILFKFFNYPKLSVNPKISAALILRSGTFYPKSSAFIRLIAPFTDKSVRSKISFEIFGENTFFVPDGTNVCIVQRTAFDSKPIAEQFVKRAREIGASIVVDNDDAFGLLDESHVEHSIQGDRYEALEYLVKEADQVWVSTDQLAKLHPARKRGVKVVPNSLDRRLWRQQNIAAKKATGGPIQLLYTGTATHEADLDMIMPALDAIAKKYPDSFELTVIGVAQGDLPKKSWIKRVRQKRDHAIYPRFAGWLLAQGPFDIGLSPLIDSDFNNCKSDIKCLDYIAMGIIPVVSDVIPYQNSELDDFIIRIKNNPDDWAKKLEAIIIDTKKFRKQKPEIIRKAQKYLWEKRSSQVTAKRLLRQLEDLRKKR